MIRHAIRVLLLAGTAGAGMIAATVFAQAPAPGEPTAMSSRSGPPRPTGFPPPGFPSAGFQPAGFPLGELATPLSALAFDPFPIPAGRPPAQVAPRDLCIDAVAGEAGGLGYMAVKLNIAAAQQPAWRRVEDAVTAGTAAKRKLCLALAAAGDAAPPALPEAMAWQRDVLVAELAELQQLQPAIAALFDVLSPEQRAALTPPGPPLPQP